MRLEVAQLEGKTDISSEWVFWSPEGGILDPDNLYHRYFVPVLAESGVRKIRLHDLRHTFGSLLIQNGAWLVYVRDQMGTPRSRSRPIRTVTWLQGPTSRMWTFWTMGHPRMQRSRCNQLQPPRNQTKCYNWTFQPMLLILLMAVGRIELPTYGL